MPPQPPVPKPPRKPFNWGSVSKTISFWILVILIPVAFIQFSGKGAEQAPEISYTQYDRELTAGNVAKVNIEAGSAITGEFKKKVLVNRREVSKFNVRLLYDPETELAGKHILLVEDIVDSGRTLGRMMEIMQERDPRSLEICALLHKRIAEGMRHDVKFVGFDAPKEFLVGYGLDHAEDFRHLPYIASLE